MKEGDYLICTESFEYMFVFREGDIFKIDKIYPDKYFFPEDGFDSLIITKVGTKLRYNIEQHHIKNNFRYITLPELRKLKLQKLKLR